MKKLLFTSLIMLQLAFVGFSQTTPPSFINYQKVLFDVNAANPNAPLSNQSFSTFVNINDELGNLLYREEHYASTDANGLITVKMGDGLYTAGPITNFNQINWGVGKYYLVVDFDINGSISSTAPEQLVTVPYSFYAGNAGNGMTAVADNGNGTLTFTYANGQTYITPTLSGVQGPAGPVGATGSSGASGPAGQSAYDLWLAQGNTGTAQDFLSASAYQIWLAQGNTGSQQTFLNTLVGPAGPAGANGAAGAQGPAGPAGSQGPAGLIASGSVAGNTPYWDGTQWVTNSSNIYNNGGNIGIGQTNPASKLEVNGAAANTLALNAGSVGTIDFGLSNLAYSSFAGTAFTLNNLKNGGAYSLILTSTSNNGTAAFTASGFTFKYMGTLPMSSGKAHIYSFIVAGTVVYVSMATEN
jgi:hypothetical protein